MEIASNGDALILHCSTLEKVPKLSSAELDDPVRLLLVAPHKFSRFPITFLAERSGEKQLSAPRV